LAGSRAGALCRAGRRRCLSLAVLADRQGRAILVADPPKTVGHREIG
jgi:hypothetical protein